MHERRPTRIPRFDYSTPNYYYVTICTESRKTLFGTPDKLSWLGRLAEQELLSIPFHYDDVLVDSYVIMPNHIHAIIVIGCAKQGTKCPALTTVIGQYKAGVARKAHEFCPEISIWQRSFYDSVIRNEAGYLQARTYIEDNPRKWAEFNSENSQREG